MNMKISRRQFLKGAGALGIGMALPLKFGVKSSHAFYQSPGLSKWQTTLRGITGTEGIHVVASDGLAHVTGVTHATINIQQFTDQLHPALGPTTLWGFHPQNVLVGSTTPRHLGGIIAVHRGTPFQLTFRNKLPAKNIIPVDTTIPGANQAQNRTAVHLHGGLVPWISDGGPFDWWAPNGTHGLSFLNNQVLNPGAAANEAEYYYPNNQSARLGWYHDHAFGITRTNAYAGIASAYIIRDTFEADLVANKGLPNFIEAGGRELPIVIQDKIFVDTNIGTADPTWVSKGLPSGLGSLWYPHMYEKNRWKLSGAGSRLPNPSVIAEMFGDTMLVNGTVYPRAPVDPRRYRLRVLNACNARFLNLQLYVDAGNGITFNTSGKVNNAKGPDFLVIGNEAGFLANPVNVASNTQFSIDALGVPHGSLITGNAERWDIIVDFKGYENQNIILYSDTPAPFPFGDPRNDYVGIPTSGPDTRVLMRFEVGLGTGVPADPPLTITPATDFRTGIDTFLNPTGVPVRRLTLNEAFDGYGRLIQYLGTDSKVGSSIGKLGRPYSDTPTETVAAGSTEIWEILNLTGDTHPIHFHLVNVQILNREAFDAVNYTGGTPALIPSTLRPPDATERGWKETVRMNPGEVTRVIMKFDLPSVPFPVPPSPRTGGNEYVWHCHILEHEEHDMMRPLVVT
jgi:spore coat protein A, manganese oxidase